MVKLALLVSGAFVVLYIDGFGNIKTNIPIDSIKSDLFNICINGKNNPIKFVKTFGEVSEGELLCYKGSNDTLEIAVNLGSAKKVLNLNVGDILKINN